MTPADAEIQSICDEVCTNNFYVIKSILRPNNFAYECLYSLSCPGGYHVHLPMQLIIRFTSAQKLL